MNDIYASNARMMGFALPALGLNSLLVSVFVFLPALYAEQRGLGAATVGLIFLFAKLVDMLVAPTCGVLMDSYSTRWGRRRPWLAASVPILALAVLMVYNPPENASVAYLFFSLALLYVGFNAWSISHTSWALELSRDYDRLPEGSYIPNQPKPVIALKNNNQGDHNGTTAAPHFVSVPGAIS